ncbi:CinA family protein [Paracoccaceae bacterium GXU_MW_L88]
MVDAAAILDLCRKQHWKIVTAESCTGGLIAARLTDIPGSSDVLDSGIVTYSYESKAELLGVSSVTLGQHGAVSGEVVGEMARGALLRRPEAALSIAVSGVAGPGASESKPEGLVWFALALRGKKPTVVKKEFGALGRAAVREKSVDFALRLIELAAKSHQP